MAETQSTLIDAVRETMQTHRIASKGERVLAGVSGGPDSVCLVHALAALDIPFGIAHMDHRARGEASDGDRAFVQALADSLRVPYHETVQPIAEEAENSPLSFEEYAREARYAWLRETAEAEGYAAVATGHHADDQAETVLMRVLRGVAPGGLAGIPPVRALGPNVRVIRPLIECSRSDIEDYLEQHNLKSRVDASNKDVQFTRNRVRHELLPLLRDRYNPRVDDALTRLADMQRAEDSYLDGATRQFLNQICPDGKAVQRVAFSQGPEALQRRAIMIMAMRYGSECTFDRIERARAFIQRAGSGKAFDLGGGVTLRNSRDVTEIAVESNTSEKRIVSLPVPGQTVALGYRFDAREIEMRKNWAAYCSPTRQVFDADAMGADVSIRLRQPGDRFSPLGLGGTKKLKDYFGDLGLPWSMRESTPLIVAGDAIAWVVGYAMDGRFAVTCETKRVIEIEVSDAAE